MEINFEGKTALVTGASQGKRPNKISYDQQYGTNPDKYVGN